MLYAGQEKYLLTNNAGSNKHIKNMRIKPFLKKGKGALISSTGVKITMSNEK